MSQLERVGSSEHVYYFAGRPSLDLSGKGEVSLDKISPEEKYLQIVKHQSLGQLTSDFIATWALNPYATFPGAHLIAWQNPHTYHETNQMWHNTQDVPVEATALLFESAGIPLEKIIQSDGPLLTRRHPHMEGYQDNDLCSLLDKGYIGANGMHTKTVRAMHAHITLIDTMQLLPVENNKIDAVHPSRQRLLTANGKFETILRETTGGFLSQHGNCDFLRRDKVRYGRNGTVSIPFDAHVQELVTEGRSVEIAQVFVGLDGFIREIHHAHNIPPNRACVSVELLFQKGEYPGLVGHMSEIEEGEAPMGTFEALNYVFCDGLEVLDPNKLLERKENEINIAHVQAVFEEHFAIQT